MVSSPGLRYSSLITALAVIVVSVAAMGCANTVNITVRNDTGEDLRIAHCVDDALNLNAGQTFHAYGIPQEGNLICRVTRDEGALQKCVSFPNADAITGTYPLSRAVRVPLSRCG